MVNKMRAKFECVSVNDFGELKRATLSAVTTGNPEDQDFHKYTPCGSLEIDISKEGAADYFKPGKKYYLDFSEIENTE